MNVKPKEIQITEILWSNELVKSLLSKKFNHVGSGFTSYNLVRKQPVPLYKFYFVRRGEVDWKSICKGVAQFLTDTNSLSLIMMENIHYNILDSTFTTRVLRGEDICLNISQRACSLRGENKFSQIFCETTIWDLKAEVIKNIILTYYLWVFSS